MMRRWLLWLLSLAFIWFVAQHLGEISEIVATLLTGHAGYIALAALFQVVHYYIYSWLYQAAFATVGFKTTVRGVLPIVVAAIGVNVVTPSGGTATTMMFMDYAAREGGIPGRAGAGTTLVYVVRVTTLVILVLATLIYMFFQGSLQVYQATGLIFLCLFLLLFDSLLFLGLRKRQWLIIALQWIRRIINAIVGTILRREVIDKEWIQTNAEEYSNAAKIISTKPRSFLKMVLIVLLMHIADIISLAALFAAYDTIISVGNVIVGYMMGMLFWIVSPTPQGIGFVEGIMALVYSSLGVELSIATVVTLAFRGLTFWLPLAIGFGLLHHIKTFKSTK